MHDQLKGQYHELVLFVPVLVFIY